MVTYKYKLYKTNKTKRLDAMLREACFVWNHALALQKRYYSLYHKYIGVNEMKKHFARRIKRNILHSQTVQEILIRLDKAYTRFFKRLSKRPPKFRRAKCFSTIVYWKTGYKLEGNTITVNSIKSRYKFSLSRPYDGDIKMISIKRTATGDYYIFLVIDKSGAPIRKTHNGASVGIDFGLKRYLTLSDGKVVENPRFLKRGIVKIREKSKLKSKSDVLSRNSERKRKDLARRYERVVNKRDDWQWKLAHELCKEYDRIFIEDLYLGDMCSRWGGKMYDLSHGEFVKKLQYVSQKYGVVVHKINRYYPSSKTCTCGFVNNELKLNERTWACPNCGIIHNRDMLAANNILRQGIAELESVRKTQKTSGFVQTRLHPKNLAL